MFSTRLQRARKAAGLSLRELGERIGLSHASIKKYEDGVAMPSSEVLIRLARALEVRSEYFFRPDRVALGKIEYRKRSSLPKKRLEAITHEVIDQIERRIELESLFPKPPVQAFSGVEGLPTHVTELGQIEDIADAVRAAWNLGLNPIPDLIDLFEMRGIRVFVTKKNVEGKFDGLATLVNDMPVVVVDGQWPGDRQRFTLAHELGHLILEGRLAGELNEEHACHRFAGAFLFPKTSALEELGQHRRALEIKELALLKEEFGLSMSAILYRARDLEIISQAYREELARLFSFKKWNRKEPGPACPAEKAHVFEQLVFHALAEDYIGESKAAELMNMPLQQFRHLRSMEGGNAAADK